MATTKELEDQLAAARKDIENLARLASERLSDEVRNGRDKATDYVNMLSDEARATFDKAREQGAYSRMMAEDKVRENPLAAVAIALGAGFVLASLLRR